LVIETAVPEPQGKALTVYQRICHAETDKVVATARVNQLLLDLSSGRPVKVPDEVAQAIARATAQERGA